MLKPFQNLFVIILAGAIGLGGVTTKAYDLLTENNQLRQELEEVKQINDQIRQDEVQLKATVTQLQLERQAQANDIDQLGQAVDLAADREVSLRARIAALESETGQLRSLLNASPVWMRAIDRAVRWARADGPWSLGFGVVAMGSMIVDGPSHRIYVGDPAARQ